MVGLCQKGYGIMLYKNSKRPLTCSDLKPYLEFIEQKCSIPFTLKTKSEGGDTFEGIIQKIDFSEEDGKIVRLKITATIKRLGLSGKECERGHSNYPMDFDNPLFQGLENVPPLPNQSPSKKLILESGAEQLAIQTPELVLTK